MSRTLGTANLRMHRGGPHREIWARDVRIRRFAQILAKFDFFDLYENLQRILFDYAQNAPHPANAPFNAAC